jgi:hypothetical protein
MHFFGIIMIYYKKNCIINFFKSNENSRCEIYIYILLYYLFINHVLEKKNSKEWSLKWYSMTKFKYFSFQINLYFLKEIFLIFYIIEGT